MEYGKRFGIEDIYPKLLPFKSKLWMLLHLSGKIMIRKSLDTIYKTYFKKIYAKKMQKGFNNPEIVLLHNELEELFEKEYLNDKTKRNDDGTWNMKNKDARLLYNLRAIMCCLLDEDTYYMLRFLYLVEMIHRDYSEYEKRMNRADAYWNWREILEGLKKGDKKWTEYTDEELKEMVKNAPFQPDKQHVDP